MTFPTAPSKEMDPRGTCIFCKICDGVEPSNIVHQVSWLHHYEMMFTTLGQYTCMYYYIYIYWTKIFDNLLSTMQLQKGCNSSWTPLCVKEPAGVSNSVKINTLCVQDEEFVVFPDMRPAAPHHYLIVTREHLTDARSLSKEHIPMSMFCTNPHSYFITFLLCGL